MRIETGRYKGENVEDRICEFCNQNAIEDEIHFIFKCDLYCLERAYLFDGNKLQDNENITNEQKLFCLFENHVNKIANYVKVCYNKRRNILYNTDNL